MTLPILALTEVREEGMNDPQKIRKMAAWYRDFAERAGNPDIWSEK
jgi:hypothetical protein